MATFTALFPGRFQPFHNGHLMVIKGMTKVCGRIVIVIGSSQEKGTAENPFSVDERREMIQSALQDEDIIPKFDVVIMEAKDDPSDEAWAKQILEQAGEIHQVWTGNPAVKACFEKTGVEVKVIKEVPGISGTDIRKFLKEGGDWKAKVPSAVADVIFALPRYPNIAGK